MLRKIISENESKILEGTKINVSTKKNVSFKARISVILAI